MKLQYRALGMNGLVVKTGTVDVKNRRSVNRAQSTADSKYGACTRLEFNVNGTWVNRFQAQQHQAGFKS